MPCSDQYISYDWIVLYRRTIAERRAVGILMLDRTADRLYANLKDAWEEEEVMIWWNEFRLFIPASGLPEGTSLFDDVLNNWSQAFVPGNLEQIKCKNLDSCLDLLYKIFVDRQL